MPVAPSPEETFVLHPPAEPMGTRPHVRWVAPGSLHVGRLCDLWESGGTLSELGRVPGPWAAVLWDPMAEAHVVMSDAVGVMPVFVATTVDGDKVVGSWLTALADRPDVDDIADPEGILLTSSMLLQSPLSARFTRIAAIRAVPWGRAVFVHQNGTEHTVRHWFPEDVTPVSPDLTIEECAHLLDVAVGQAIADQLPPPGTKVAAHISSGLDCTTVAIRVHEALRQRGERLTRGYSWSPDEREVPRFEGDERQLLDEISAVSGVPIWTRHSDESGDWFLELDPTRFPDNTLGKERFVLPHAAADGVEILFSGWGGDELCSFNGRRVPETLLRRGHWRPLWLHSRIRHQVVHGTRAGLRHRWKFLNLCLRIITPHWVKNALRPLTTWRDVRNRRNAIRRLRTMSPDAAEAYVQRSRSARQAKTFREYQLFLLNLGHLQDRTRSWYQVGRLHGVTYRYPLLDIRVVECALSLPWSAFLSQGWDRVAFRTMSEKYVPLSVAWNVTKIEPANFYPPERNEPYRSRPEPDIVFPDHPGVNEALSLASSLTRPHRPAHRGDKRIITRPEARPKQVEHLGRRLRPQMGPD